jgi:hypothetical protein
VLSAHQGGGEPLLPMPLEITRCLNVPGESWLLLLHLCDVGLVVSWLSTLLGPMAKLATVVVGVVSCRLLVAGGAAVDASAGATLGTSSRPGLGASARLTRLVALTAARRGRGLPLLPVTLTDLPLFPSEM